MATEIEAAEAIATVVEASEGDRPPSVTDVIEAEAAREVAGILARAEGEALVSAARTEGEIAIIEARAPDDELRERVSRCEEQLAILTEICLGETGLLSQLVAKVATSSSPSPTVILTPPILPPSSSPPPLLAESESEAVLPEAVASPPPKPAKRRTLL